MPTVARDTIVGSWRLVGIRSGPDSVDPGPWDAPDVPRAMTIFADGTAVIPGEGRKQWSVSDGSVEGLFSYAVGFKRSGNGAFSSSKPRSERWRRSAGCSIPARR